VEVVLVVDVDELVVVDDVDVEVDLVVVVDTEVVVVDVVVGSTNVNLFHQTCTSVASSKKT